METCTFCNLDYPEIWDCRSCGESFCDGCFDAHFLNGPHIVVSQGGFTEWVYRPDESWPRKLIAQYSYVNDRTERDIWIPALQVE